MTLFVRLLDVPVDDKAERLLKAVRGDGGHAMHREAADMVNVPGGAFVYWLQPELMNLFQLQSRWGDYASRCGLGTLDDFRFLRLWWEVPAGDAGWVPFAKGGRFSPFHTDITLKLNWHGGDELKASVEKKVGSASRKVQGQEFYFNEGITWQRRPHIIGSFQLMPKGCIYSDNGPGIFTPNQNDLKSLCAILNSAPYLYLLESIMPRGSEGGQTLVYEAGYITSVPILNFSKNDTDKLADLSIRGWKIGLDKFRSLETSLRFTSPVSPSSCENFSASMTEVLELCDQLSIEAMGLNEAAITEISAWASARRQQADSTITVDDEKTYRLKYLSWCVGCAFGRFRSASVDTQEEVCGPFDTLPSLPPAASYVLHNGFGEIRRILVDDRGHADDIVAAIIPFAKEDPEGIIDADPEQIRSWVSKQFFADHIGMYTEHKRKAPIYWQISTKSSSYSVWLYYPTLTSDTLYRALTDYVEPKLYYERSVLAKMRDDYDDMMTPSQRKAVDRQQKFVEELQSFSDEIRKITIIWTPKLDDGVVVNFAPLWRLVSHNKAWQKDLTATWLALSEGKRDWAGIALRLWPERVVSACAEDRSLAIAHGLEANFWEKNDSGKWAAKLFPDRSVEDIVAGLLVPAVQEALAQLQTPAEPEAPVRKTRRRS